MEIENLILLPFIYAFIAVIPFMGLWLYMSIKHGNELIEYGRRKYDIGKKWGHMEGFKKGLQAHIMTTSELTDKENELLTKFLIRHDFVLCYDSDINGFRVRRDGRFIKKVISIVEERDIKLVDNEYEANFINSKSIPLIQYEIDRLDFEMMEEKRQMEERRRAKND